MHELINKSFEYRAEVLANEAAIVRLCAGAGDALPGLIIDKFGKLIVATIYNSDFSLQVEEILKACQQKFPACYIIVRVRERSADNSFKILCSHDEIPPFVIAEENGLKYEIRFDARHDFGIFRDAAAARALLAKICKEKRVLNLFAYTCAFGVTGAYYGAGSVTNVDPNKEYLTWAKKNAVLNGVDFAVVPDTSQKYLSRQVKRKCNGGEKPFDIIITDPPAFGVGRGSDRTLRNYWPQMLEQLAVLEPDEIILLCNDRSIKGSANLQKMVQQILGDYQCKSIQHPTDVTGQNHLLIDNWFQPPDMLILNKK